MRWRGPHEAIIVLREARFGIDQQTVSPSRQTKNQQPITSPTVAGNHLTPRHYSSTVGTGTV
jgi:hypothetical protein